VSSLVGPCCSFLTLSAHQRHFLAVGLSMENLFRLALIFIPAAKDTKCRFKEAVFFVGDVVIVLVVRLAVLDLAFEFQVLIKIQSDLAWFPAKGCFGKNIHRPRRHLLLQWLKARYAKHLLGMFILYRINRNSVAFSA